MTGRPVVPCIWQKTPPGGPITLASDSPYVTNEIIKRALHPDPGGLHIVTKVGSVCADQYGWNTALAGYCRGLHTYGH